MRRHWQIRKSSLMKSTGWLCELKWVGPVICAYKTPTGGYAKQTTTTTDKLSIKNERICINFVPKRELTRSSSVWKVAWRVYLWSRRVVPIPAGSAANGTEEPLLACMTRQRAPSVLVHSLNGLLTWWGSNRSERWSLLGEIFAGAHWKSQFSATWILFFFI